MATGDILDVRIASAADHNGFVAEIDIEGLDIGGDYEFGMGVNNDPTNAKIVFTITSPGYDTAGNPTTIQRTIYGTQWVRKAYPDQLIAHEDFTDVPPEGMIVTWGASPDHDEVDPVTGDAILSSYEFRLYKKYTNELVGTDNVGKPTPVSGEITVSNSPLLIDLAPETYILQIVALGPNSSVSPDQVAISYSVEFTV